MKCGFWQPCLVFCSHLLLSRPEVGGFKTLKFSRAGFCCFECILALDVLSLWDYQFCLGGTCCYFPSNWISCEDEECEFIVELIQFALFLLDFTFFCMDIQYFRVTQKHLHMHWNASCHGCSDDVVRADGQISLMRLFWLTFPQTIRVLHNILTRQGQAVCK